MSTLDDILVAPELVRYASHYTEEPLALASLFPEVKRTSLDLKLIKGANNVPVSAEVHAFDSETQLADFDDYNYDTAQLLLIKRQYHIGEEFIIRLNQTNSDPVIQEIKQEIYNGINTNLLNAIKVRVERMRAELLQTGKVVINENGIKGLTVDYKMPKTNLVTGDWSDPSSAKPLDDIEKWMGVVEDASEGIKPTRALTRRTKLRQLLSNTQVRKEIWGSSNEQRLSLNKYNEWAQSNDFPTIGVYEGSYRQQLPSGKKVLKKYLDDKSFILLPETELGETVYGPTAEEIELSQDPSIAISSNNFVTLETYRSPDSPAKFVKAVTTALPTAPYINEVLTATIE